MKPPKFHLPSRLPSARVTLLLLLAGSAFVLALAAFLLVRWLTLAGTQAAGGDPAFGASGQQQGQVVDSQGTPLLPNPNQPVSMPELTPWDGASRVTVLVMGLDYREWEEQDDGPSRSDTMILLTLDPLTRTAGILSIPRDMWVAIPGFKHGKINTAYYLGEAYQLPGGGPGLAVKTVEQFLGVPVNFYAQIDFDAFVRFIDEIGGVKVEVPEKITIDLLGDGAKTIKKLQPGVQVLPGEWALAYARNRKTEGGDFDRAQRQQQVILGIRDRVLSLNMLPTLVTKAPTLYNQLASGIHTNLTLDQAIKLALLAQEVGDENIQRGVLGEEYVVFGTSPDQLSILVPIPDKIHLLRDQIFTASSSLGPAAPGSSQEQMAAEGARLAVLNGSGQPGLAERTADALRSAGANVAQVGEADGGYAVTTVIDHTGNPYALKYLVEQIGISAGKIVSQYDPASPVDVELVLGSDWAANNSLP